MIPEVRPEEIILEVQEEEKPEQSSLTCTYSNDKIEVAVNLNPSAEKAAEESAT